MFICFTRVNKRTEQGEYIMKNPTEKREIQIAACAVILLICTIIISVQGYFEILDYLPHITTDSCALCGAYTVSIPCTVIADAFFGIAALIYFYKGKTRLLSLMPYFYMLSVVPSLVYDFIFVTKKGFVADGEYNIIVYLVTDLILLLNSVIFVQLIGGRFPPKAAFICPLIYLLGALLYLSSVFVFYGSFAETNFMGYYFCSSVASVILAVLIYLITNVIYTKQKSAERQA